MGRFQLRVTLLMPLAFAAMNMLAQLYGGMQPPHPALVGFTEGCADKPTPCWHGIVPGVTSEREALAQMQFAGEGKYSYDDLTQSYTVFFTLPETGDACRAAFRITQGIVRLAEVSLCLRTDVRLGDMVGLWNGAEKIVSAPPHDLIGGALSINADGWFSPHTRVIYINLLARPDRAVQFPWHGFVPRWRYCQLEPEYPRC